MAELEMLTREDHRSLRLLPPRFDNRHFVQIVNREIVAAAAQHPLVFNKHVDTGRFYLGAVSGFREGENLFVNGDGSYDGYRPLDVQREAFFIGEDAVLVDLASPRFSSTGGDPLFDDHGEPAVALNAVRQALTQLQAGLAETELFVTTMLDLNLIEPVDIDLRFDDGDRISLDGVYTISIDALQRLDDTQVVALFRRGYLQLAHAIIASLRQIRIMARRRNDRLRER